MFLSILCVDILSPDYYKNVSDENKLKIFKSKAFRNRIKKDNEYYESNIDYVNKNMPSYKCRDLLKCNEFLYKMNKVLLEINKYINEYEYVYVFLQQTKLNTKSVKIQKKLLSRNISYLKYKLERLEIHRDVLQFQIKYDCE